MTLPTLSALTRNGGKPASVSRLGGLSPFVFSLILHGLAYLQLDGWVVRITDNRCPCHDWHERVFVSSEELEARQERVRLRRLSPSAQFLGSLVRDRHVAALSAQPRR